MRFVLSGPALHMLAIADSPVAEGLDQRALDAIRSLEQPGSAAVLQRVLGIYLKNSPKLVQTMHDAAKAGDAAALGNAAHALKSSSIYVGAARFGALCREIEAAAKSTPPVVTASRVATLESEYLRVEQLLRAELEHGKE